MSDESPFPKLGARVRFFRHEKAGKNVGIIDDGEAIVLKFWFPHRRTYHYEVLTRFDWEFWSKEAKDKDGKPRLEVLP